MNEIRSILKKREREREREMVHEHDLRRFGPLEIILNNIGFVYRSRSRAQ